MASKRIYSLEYDKKFDYYFKIIVYEICDNTSTNYSAKTTIIHIND